MLNCKVFFFWLLNHASTFVLPLEMINSQMFTFCRHSEGLLDLGEIEDHGQLVYLTTVGQVAGSHDRRDAQLLLQNAESQLVVVNRAGLIQGGHVTVEE